MPRRPSKQDLQRRPAKRKFRSNIPEVFLSDIPFDLMTPSLEKIKKVIKKSKNRSVPGPQQEFIILYTNDIQEN